jgi:putative transposase
VVDHGKTLADLKDKERDAWLLAHLDDMAPETMPRVAAADLGRKNLATVAYSWGPKADVHTGGRFTANMEELVGLIAKRVSSITPVRANELQARKTELRKAGQKLPCNEEMELRTLLKAVYQDPEYRRLMDKKNRWSDDFLHKVSSHIVKVCADRRVQVIVIGRNKGWKQEVNMGTEQNRLFCQIAHARLIELIRYKAEARGIGVVTTEESYTSKTSFVNGDQLECYTDKERDAAPATKPVLTGRRSSVDRNWYYHRNRDDRWKWVHADVNGAFNIIRKVFRRFAYHDGLTLKFNLLRVSPRLGVTPLRLA